MYRILFFEMELDYDNSVDGKFESYQVKDESRIGRVVKNQIKKRAENEKTKKREYNPCVDMKPATETLKLFENDFKDVDKTLGKLFSIFKNIEDNLFVYNSNVSGQHYELCDEIVRDFSNLDYMVGQFQPRDIRFINLIKQNYKAIAQQLLYSKSYSSLVKAQGLFMNVKDFGVLSDDEKKELEYIYKRTLDDFQKYQRSKGLHAEQASPHDYDENAMADFELFKEWLTKLSLR